MKKHTMDYSQAAAQFVSALTADFRTGIFERLSQAAKGEAAVLSRLSAPNCLLLPSELSKETQCTAQRITAILNSLEKKGFVTREMDKSDRRKILVRITDAGREKAELDRSEISARLEKVFRQLGGQNTAEFIRLTERFLQLSPKFNHE